MGVGMGVGMGAGIGAGIGVGIGAGIGVGIGAGVGAGAGGDGCGAEARGIQITSPICRFRASTPGLRSMILCKLTPWVWESFHRVSPVRIMYEEAPLGQIWGAGEVDGGDGDTEDVGAGMQSVAPIFRFRGSTPGLRSRMLWMLTPFA